MDADQQAAVRKKDRNRKAEKWANMTEEEKNLLKENNRLNKKKMREKKKEEQRLDKDKGFTSTHRMQNWRKNRSPEEAEYIRIETLLMMRKTRQERNGKEHLLDNLDAKRGMRDLREIGPLDAYMQRRRGEIEEEQNWRKFHQRGDNYRALLGIKKPVLAKKFKEEEDEYWKEWVKSMEKDKKLREEREKREKELDEQGRWKYDNCNGDYFWTIPDENGHYKSLTHYNMECEAKYQQELEAKEALLTPEEKEERKRKALEKKRKEKEEEERMLELEIEYYRKERNRKQKERRDKQKEELSKPITMRSSEKSKYEEARDETIRQRHDAMKESGLFNDTELARILETIV